jgi:NTE family protein
MEYNAKFENLVFKGGGVKGAAYAGALLALESNEQLDDLKKVAGTSAGAITACLVALKYKAARINAILMQMDFKIFKDRFKISSLRRFGIHSGDHFEKWMGECIKCSNKAPNVKELPAIELHEKSTFADFKKAGCLDLKVFATTLNTQKIVEFSFEATPNKPVLEAIRASMSIPVFFDAVEYEGDILVDGGVLYNYPVTCFDEPGFSKHRTMGLYLCNLTGHEPSKPLDFPGFNPVDIADHFFIYTDCLLESVLQVQDLLLEKEKDDIDRTLKIDDFGISATDFDLSEDCKKALINSGIKAVEDILRKNDLLIKTSSPYFLPPDFTPADECVQRRNQNIKIENESVS